MTNPTRRGVSLVEVLVVTGLLGVLAGLALPAVQSVREAAARAACQNTLRQQAVGLHQFHSRHGRLPPAGPRDVRNAFASTSPNVLLSWFTHLLPDVGESARWQAAVEACRQDRRVWLNPPHAGLSQPVKVYTCPSDSRLDRPNAAPKGGPTAFASYLGNAGSFVGPPVRCDGTRCIVPPGVLDEVPGVRFAQVTDGLSSTLMVGERPPPDTWEAGQFYQRLLLREPFGGPDVAMWYKAGVQVANDPCGGGHPFGPGRLDNRCDMRHYWSLHRGGANFAFCDGSVRFLPYSAEPLISPLSTRAAGDAVGVLP